MVALLIRVDLNLQVALVGLIAVNVLVESLIDVHYPGLDVFCLRQDLVSELLDAFQTLAGSLKDGLGHEYVRITHELLVLAHLLVEEMRENVACDDLVLLGRCCDRGCGLSAQLPVSLLRFKSQSTG